MVSATGGTTPYKGAGPFSHAAGTYSYTVPHGNSCTSITTATIPQPEALVFSFFNDTTTSDIYTLSLHDALPICTTPYSGTGTFSHAAGTYSYTVTDAN